MAMSLGDVPRRLRELIAALDRRIPRTAGAAEDAIARDAAVLREEAVSRLAEIDQTTVSTAGTPRQVS